MLTEQLRETIQSAYTGLLASRELRPRYGQRLMIAEVARTLTKSTGDRVAVIEAGTGTGKTIAYTLAAVPVAQALEKTLVISTATIALQEQIIYKDLPDIQQHSGLSFSYALAKGRGRYLCLSKLDQLLTDQEASEQALALYPDEQAARLDSGSLGTYQAMLAALGEGSWDGDRDSWAAELEPAVWGRVTTDHAQCSGRRCSHVSQCSFFRAREQLTKVDVIVTNHDLVMADLALGGGAILPEPEDCIYIFDEGHHLPDKAIDHFACFCRLNSTRRWLDQVLKAVGRAGQELGNGGGIGQHLQLLPDQLQAVQQGLQQLAAYLPEQLELNGEYYRFSNGLVPAGIREYAGQLAPQLATIQDQLTAALAILEEALEGGHAINRSLAELWYPALASVLARCQSSWQLFADYAAAEREEQPPRGRWLAMREDAGGGEIELASSPILAANTLQRYLWQRCYAAIVTSATLTALGRFDRFRMRAGTPEEASYLTVPSPFNYAEAGELVVPSMDADPSDPPAHTDALIRMLPELLDPAHGSLVLFASKSQMEQVYDGLPADWQQRILVQGNVSKQVLVTRHKAAIDAGQGSVIFGLASFAEGIDLPGDYCRHVVIAKIPFAVPDQPIEAALAEWVQQRGGNPFMDITVPDAAIRLVQASGRLLRTESDQGRITLLDRRIVSRRYGQAMLASLPPFRQTLSR